MAFKGRDAKQTVPDSPELLYSDLPRTRDAVPGLWTHQGDILRSYVADHLETSDLALELPTGTGKTLPGLLIADWVRMKRARRVAYACPTQQLARQVSQTARREGFQTVLLYGSHKQWPVGDRASFEAADAVAITTYSSIFNSSPKLASPDLIVFDDAHAGEQYVAGAYGVFVKRADSLSTYLEVLSAIAPAFDEIFLERLRSESPDANVHRQVRVVLPAQDDQLAKALDRQLAQRLDSRDAFSFSMIRGGLASCLVYLTYAGILVRPLVPPTHENAVFVGARQRVYLSATLGHCGELERAFGRERIERLALPDSAPSPRSGRRFFVFADLVPQADSDSLTREIVNLAGKALVLTPDLDSAGQVAALLAQPGWPVFTKSDVEESLEPFALSEHATCGLANRYDGLDLPGDACRLVVLEGLPDSDSLQERFLTERARAGTALAERIRTRVVQGAGRCTRGPNDSAVVVVRGSDLTNYLLRPETRQALDPELQAEIDFGVANSKLVSEEVVENVEIFLEQGEAWRTAGEAALADFRRAAMSFPPPGSAALAASARLEIDACSLAWNGLWGQASATVQKAATALGEAGEATRGYRAVLLYLAGVWSDRAGREAENESLKPVGRDLIRQADAAARPAQWVREMRSLPESQSFEREPEDLAAANALASRLHAGVARGKHDSSVQRMIEGLSQPKASLYEPALTTLGKLLGADAYKPAPPGRCDSVWCWDDRLWIAIEAKSEHLVKGVVPLKDVRQANDQLRFLATDRATQDIPPGSATILVSPKPAVDPDAVASAEPHVFLQHPAELLLIAQAVDTAWEELLAKRHALDEPALRILVLNCFHSHGLLPSEVVDRLTQSPVAKTQ